MYRVLGDLIPGGYIQRYQLIFVIIIFLVVVIFIPICPIFFLIQIIFVCIIVLILVFFRRRGVFVLV